MRSIVIALLLAGACSSKKPPAPAQAAAAARVATPAREDRPRVLSPQEIKAKVEGAEQQHEEKIDKRFDEAQKQAE